jgi:hypothetical protein
MLGEHDVVGRIVDEVDGRHPIGEVEGGLD